MTSCERWGCSSLGRVEMSLLRLYAEALEKNITQQEIQRLWPDALIAWDRDSNGVSASFFQRRNADGSRDLFANSKLGWWVYDDESTLRLTTANGSSIGRWERCEKPSMTRRDTHRRGNAKNGEINGDSISAMRALANDPENSDREQQSQLQSILAPMKGGGSPELQKMIRAMSSQEREARLAQEEVWAQTYWPENEPYLTPYILRFQNKGR